MTIGGGASLHATLVNFQFENLLTTHGWEFEITDDCRAEAR